AGYFGALGYTMYVSVTREKSIEARIEEIKASESYTVLSDVPEIYKDAVIAVEDSRFYEHGGVDFVSLIRAVVVNVKNSELSQGGSTITQQFAKNLLFSHEQSLSRKMAEFFATYYIEKHYEKDEILELYMNVIYYGDGYYNIHDASLGYFGVEPKDMSDYQATLLAGIPNAPSVYAPTKNPELAKKRQDKVLERMVETNVLTNDEKTKILQER
ncbi:MAG: transglycosylase domain-containing protein, partial [Clostridia bacterium]|nr:transglycosylase domain-containing protein [Clostridia bacterium]